MVDREVEMNGFVEVLVREEGRKLAIAFGHLSVLANDKQIPSAGQPLFASRDNDLQLPKR